MIYLDSAATSFHKPKEVAERYFAHGKQRQKWS